MGLALLSTASAGLAADPESSAEPAGPWKFHPGHDPAWAAADLDDSTWAEITVPGPWGRQGYEGLELGWYRRPWQVAAAREPLGLSLGRVATSYRVYLNGEPLGELQPQDAGLVSHRKIHPIPDHLLPEGGSLVVAIAVARDPGAGRLSGGLLSGPVELGPLEDLVRRHLVQRFLPRLLSAFLGGIALVPLVAFLLDRRRWAALWLALANGAAALAFLVSTPAGLIHDSILLPALAICLTGFGLLRFLWAWLHPGESGPTLAGLRALTRWSNWLLLALPVLLGLALLADVPPPILARWKWALLVPGGAVLLLVAHRLLGPGSKEGTLTLPKAIPTAELGPESALGSVREPMTEMLTVEIWDYVSHELRTPLSGILGMTELLLATELDDDQQEYAATLHSSASSLRRLVDSVLDASSLAAGTLHLETRDFHLGRLLTGVVRIFQVQAEERETPVELELGGDLDPWYQGDPYRLRQVLLNLVGNALTATHRGEVRLRAETTSQGRVHFEVRDTGPGIAPAQIPRLFQAFRSGGGPRAGGSGLGLPICHRLVALMGGELQVESQLGSGSRFSFDLPLRPPERTTEELRRATATLAPMVHLQEPTFPPGLRALIADDDSAHRRLLAAQLSSLGFETATVEHGLQALERLQARAYDLLLVDLEMPILDGYETSRRIRQSEKAGTGRRLPIVTITAHLRSRVADACRQAGIDRVVTKPFSRRDLAFAAEAALQGLEAEGPDGPSSPAGAPVELGASLDLDILEGLRELDGPGGDQSSTSSVFQEIISLFLSTGPPRLASLRRAFETGDRRLAADTAHALRGSAATLGALELMTLCRQVEDLARKPDGGPLEIRTLEAVEIAYRRAAEELRAHQHHPA